MQLKKILSASIYTISLLIVILFSSLNLTAQINVLWESRFTSSGQNSDAGKEIAIDNIGNVYVTGTSRTSVANSFDIVTIKYDPLGNQLWSAIFNGSASSLDEARDIAVDKNGNVFVTGYTASTGPNYDYITIKYNNSGVQQWANSYNGTGNGYDEAYALAVDTNGNVYVTGGSDVTSQGSNYVTIKYNGAGVQQWATSYNGPGNSIDAATQIKLDAQFNVYVSGHSYGSGTDLDIATIKYNNAGTQQWVSRFNGTLNLFDVPEALHIDNMNNIYVAGSTYGGIATDNDYVTIKYDNAGTQQWAKILDGPLNEEDKAFDVLTDANLNVYVTGRSMGLGGTGENMRTLKYDSSGNLLWQDTYNGPASGYDDAQQMRLGNSGSLYVTGYSAGTATNNDYLTLKYDTANGNILWEARFDGPASNNDQAFAMEIDAAESIYVTGTSYDPTSFQDFSTIKWCQLNADAGNDVAICLGDTIQLSLNAPGALSYLWTPSTGLDDDTTPNPNAFPTTTTTYVVAATNALGCTDYDTVVVTVNSLPSNTIAASGPTSFCMGDSVTLTAPLAQSYGWSPTGDTTQSIKIFNAGLYSVLITDSNGCKISGQDTITVFSLPNVSAGPDANLCNGSSMLLNATGALNYTWNTEKDLSDSTIANPLINPTTPTTFWVIGVDTNGCKKIDSVFIAISIAPTAILSPPSPNDTLYLNIPNGGDIQFFANLSTNVISYDWTFGDGGTANVQNPIYTYTAQGLWNVELITTNGSCKDTANMSVMVYNGIGITENISKINYSIYPNPTKGNIYIDFKNINYNNVQINIYDITGKLLQEELYTNTNFITINPENFNNGLYLIEMILGNEKIINRISISR
jgi:hypothetical protein